MDATVTVRGRNDLVLPSTFRGSEEFPWIDRHFQIDPVLGDPLEGNWAGVPVSALLEWVDLPNEATHLLLEGLNGYRAPVAIDRSTDALLAFERLDDRGMTPRFVAPELDIRQCVCQVTTVEWLAVSGGDDPMALAAWEPTDRDQPA